jgi:hypothetical protein
MTKTTSNIFFASAPEPNPKLDSTEIPSVACLAIIMNIHPAPAPAIVRRIDGDISEELRFPCIRRPIEALIIIPDAKALAPPRMILLGRLKHANGNAPVAVARAVSQPKKNTLPNVDPENHSEGQNFKKI